VIRIALADKGFAKIDDDDLWIVASIRWYLQDRSPWPSYAIGKIKGRNILMHRLILDAKRGQLVDHIDGNGLDNRRINLRFVTAAQNILNRRLISASGYKGIVWKRDAWYGRIYVEGRCLTRKGKSPEDAARKYDDLAVERYGAHACVNFPERFPNLNLRCARPREA
jgi:hypothetical protein